MKDPNPKPETEILIYKSLLCLGVTQKSNSLFALKNDEYPTASSPNPNPSAGIWMPSPSAAPWAFKSVSKKPKILCLGMTKNIHKPLRLNRPYDP